MPILLERVRESFNKARQTLIPKQAFSWQTLIALCLFSYLMAALASPRIREFLSTCGWIFLILGVGWATTEKPIKLPNWNLNLGPWITGALVSLFLFEGLLAKSLNLAWVSWPIISVMIASLPKFFDGDFKYKPPQPKDRQLLVILILANVVLSCWLQFHFTVQNWSREYPSLTSEGIGRSNFVVQFNFGSRPSQGQDFLEQAKAIIQANINDRPWAEAELWLFELKQQPNLFERQIFQRARAQTQNSKPIQETFLWSIVSQILPGTPYNLQVFASWQGPSANNQGYYLSLSCSIQEVNRRSRLPPSPANPEEQERIQESAALAGAIAEPANRVLIASPTVGRANCGPVSDRIPGKAPTASP